MGELHETCCSKIMFWWGMNKLDQESMALMTNAERDAEKLNQDAFPFHQKRPCRYVARRSSTLSFDTTKEGKKSKKSETNGTAMWHQKLSLHPHQVNLHQS
jgi:hypothetical protein